MGSLMCHGTAASASDKSGAGALLVAGAVQVVAVDS